MARIRSVHPGLFTDEKFVMCSPFARLLAIGIWTEADDQGVFEWKPVTLKMRLMAVDNVNVAELLAELAGADIIKRYTADGRDYGAVRNFRRFQRPKKPNHSHPLPDEFRTYVALSADSSEPDDDEPDGGSVPPKVKPPPVPQKGEKSPQMEDGGDKREEEREEKISPSGETKKKRATRLPEDFVPTESMRKHGKSKGLSDRQIDLEGEKIRDWSLSSPNGAKLDWEAGWRNWLANGKDAPRAQSSAKRGWDYNDIIDKIERHGNGTGSLDLDNGFGASAGDDGTPEPAGGMPKRSRTDGDAPILDLAPERSDGH